ncbi:hypothetical protein M5K25_027653 [Dendrobium thyrsiflorum]|uniref:Uncharacterized protein n=1 Tax=Dendrobium thyrsiflorum TaxID=117978 RepID=A0ABD0TUS0_DENTH
MPIGELQPPSAPLVATPTTIASFPKVDSSNRTSHQTVVVRSISSVGFNLCHSSTRQFSAHQKPSSCSKVAGGVVSGKSFRFMHQVHL